MAIKVPANHITSPKLLEKIDKLRDRNIHNDIPLPQLVVVGDQSSGKSSLLESITGIPFPRGTSLVTRHATRIMSRRQNQESVVISIEAGPSASLDHQNHLKSFKKTLKSTSELNGNFLDIFTAARDMMGLGPDTANGNCKAFSEHVLKVEVYGPSQDFLTIIDVPGIFRTRTKGISKDDMKVVRTMVRRYIKDSRTVILAVLPCNAEFAAQEVLELAEKYDADGERTLGVLTKPDLVSEPSLQREICDNIMSGEKRSLALGYILVRNKSEDEESITEAELDQSLFNTPAWSSLPKEHVGIAALKSRLGELLLKITAREFPSLIRDINAQISSCEKRIGELGPPRQLEREQRSYLSSIVAKFNHLVDAGLNADYTYGEGFFRPELRMITHHESYRSVRERPGANFVDEPSADSAEAPMDRLYATLLQTGVDDITDQERMNLAEVVEGRVQNLVPPAPGISERIDEIYYQSRGLVLGGFDPKLIDLSFAKQSQKWESLTMSYVTRVIIIIHRFLFAALESACPESQVRNQIRSTILGRAIATAKHLVDVERHGRPYTVNKTYQRALAESDQRRTGPSLVVSLNAIEQTASSLASPQQIQRRIHDILRAYYKVALDRFVDNVYKQVIDFSLLHGFSSPLKVLNHDWVLGLEPEELSRIAGESGTTKKHRTKLKREMANLAAALSDMRTE
ncbi:P-loop containing nucleoside triphosphate hydrolase protein [Microdochium trichocladiopsis]|uniref:P-loop containing nucleoside triphosphate hydrolase protein n=1 Tax=Microdochium trichocladiopsis TaxID=1682393 RepID=A0A9P8Y157_9PEZI|nr:P-loop containing nucleoside triphosphate hydrolase protein [Microdochium trichocladiopsis]KAH7027973.1 P-loop containing nucleoside triphosphate hydrolase protein [Microdochium trichocladiopsis]